MPDLSRKDQSDSARRVAWVTLYKRELGVNFDRSNFSSLATRKIPAGQLDCRCRGFLEFIFKCWCKVCNTGTENQYFWNIRYKQYSFCKKRESVVSSQRRSSKASGKIPTKLTWLYSCGFTAPYISPLIQSARRQMKLPPATPVINSAPD